ncbi:hypothetical protein ABPG75_002981 [Micractinium tetrahymenae]
MGAPPAAAAAAAATAGSTRQARLPRRLLAASAIVVALATSLLVLAAVGTGHTELRLSAGVQLSIGRVTNTAAQEAAGDAAAVGAAAAAAADPDQQQQQQQAQPPLPEGEPPPVDGSGSASLEEEQEVAYGAAYEGADLVALFGGKAGPGGGQGQPAGAGGGSGSARPAGGTPAKTVRPTPVVTPEAAAARDSGAACGEALYVKKVALMFLTTRRLAHEKLWRLWMWDAAGMLPLQALPLAQDAICGPSASAEAAWQRVLVACAGAAAALEKAAKGSAATLLPPQLLFNIYVHAPPNYQGLEFQPLFQGKVLGNRLATQWGSAAIMDAERALLEAALRDPANERFVLLSDTDIPLYDPLTFYQQLMHESKSRVRACRDGHMSIDRWKDAMATPQLKKQHWRKSNQFFGLTRKHAELVAADSKIFRAFKERCGGWYGDVKQWKECVPDEHYIPTLLASLGLENETYCGGWGVAYTDWSTHDIHPRSFLPKEVTPHLLKQMRWWCKHQKEAGQDAQRMFVPVPELLKAATPQQACHRLQAAGGSSNNTAGGTPVPSNSSSSISSGSVPSPSSNSGNSSSAAGPTYAHPIDGSCPLTARKFPAFTALRVRQLFLSSCPAGMQVQSKAAQAFAVQRDPEVVLLRGTACTAAVQRMTLQQPGGKRRMKRRRRRAS